MNKETAKKLVRKTKQDYEKIAQDFSETRFALWKEFDQFLPYVKDGDAILDLGCGNGRLFELFKDRPIKYVGLDSSNKLIKEASQKFSRYQEKCQFVVGDVLEPGTRHPPALKLWRAGMALGTRGMFDVVFLIAVLHHIPTKELQLKVLKNIYSVLKKDGYLIMTNWNLYQPRYFSFLIKKYFSAKLLKQVGWNIKDALIPWKATGKQIIWRYYHAFTLGELIKLVKKAGFEVEKAYYVCKGEEVNLWKAYNIVVIVKKC